MKPKRSDLARRLHALGQQPVVGPTPEFSARLEERLGEGTWHPSTATTGIHSRRRKLVAAGIAAAVLTMGGSVAALTIAPNGDHTVVHTMTDGDPTTTAPTPTTATSSTTTIAPEPTTAAVAPPPISIEPPTSAAPTTVAAPSTTAHETPSTEPTTEAPTTEAPATTTATTEAHPPETLALSCAPFFDGGRWLVRCEWSASTAGDVTHYRVLRSVVGQTGRAFEVGGDATRYIDTTVELGVAYRYLVRAERANGTVAEVSPLVSITWPQDPATTTTSTSQA